MKVRDLAIVALLGAAMFAVQVAMAALPNIELVSLLVITGTLTFRRRAVYAIYIFVLLEGLVYGFGLWWVMYLYVWGILAGITWLLRKNTSVIVWAAVAGGFGLIFGALCAIPYFFTGGVTFGISYWISGIPFDLLHCGGNVLVTLVLFRPIHSAFERIQQMIGKET